MLQHARLVATNASARVRFDRTIPNSRKVVQAISEYVSIARTKPARAPCHTPCHRSSDVTGVVAGVAAIGALFGVAKMWMDATNQDRVPSSLRVKVDNISRNDIAQFYTDLRLSIEQLFSQLSTLDASFRAQLKDNNVELSDDDYKQTFQQKLFEIIANIEHQVLQESGWDRTALATAMERYADDDEIKQLQNALQEVMHSIFPPPQLPEHLTSQKALEILTVIVNGMEQAMRDMLQHARSEGITAPDQAMAEFQQIYIEQVEQLTFQELKKHNVSQEMFNFAVQKFYSENSSFRAEVDRIYEAQAVSFRRLGLDVDEQVD